MKRRNKVEPKVHKNLEGFNIKIDNFGEVKGNFNIDKIIDFLNENLDDKKLKKEE